MTAPKKIILISLDTLRADHLGCYGYYRNTSPVIDELAKNNIMFNYAFTTCSFTLPAHASMFTSKYPKNHSVQFNNSFGKLDPDIDITLAEVLQSHDYKTAAFISGVPLRKETNLNIGFQHYDDEMMEPEMNRKDQFIRDGFETTTRTIHWINEHLFENFFVFIHYFDIHGPYIPPEQFKHLFINDQYYGNKFELNTIVADDDPKPMGIPSYQRLKPIYYEDGKLLTFEKDIRYYISQYDAEIRYCDYLIGVLLESLKTQGIYDDCLIIITSDHGESLGENNFYFYHGLTVTPDQIVVPFIIKPPSTEIEGLKLPTTIDTPVSGIDIMPTLLSLCKIDYSDLLLEGNSLLEILKNHHDTPLNTRQLLSENEYQAGIISPDCILETYEKDPPSSNYYAHTKETISQLNGKKYFLKQERELIKNNLYWTGERYLPYIDPAITGTEIHYEHLHRYAFASQFVQGKTILDLACGEGYGSFILSKTARNVIGIDIDFRTIQHASHVYTKDNLEFIEGSILKIPISESKKFDVIICFEAIEHITEHELLMSEILRLLKDEGLLIISTPNKKIYAEKPHFHNPFHEKELYFNEFKELLKNNFPSVQFFGQKTIAGSNISSLSQQVAQNCSEFIIDRTNEKFSFKSADEKLSRYFVALASRKEPDDSSITNSYLIDISNTEVSILNTQIAQKNSAILSLQQQIEERELQIEKISAHNKNIHQIIAAKDQQLSDLTANVQSLEQVAAEKETQIQSLEQVAAEKETQIQSLEQKITSIENSIVWQFTMKFHTKVVERLLPQNTRKRDYYNLWLKGGRLFLHEGMKKTLFEYKNYCKLKRIESMHKKISDPAISPDNDISTEKTGHLSDKATDSIPEYVPLSQQHITLTKDDIKFIAFYLPQFHPIPENDAWWGKGFTEWTNVTKAIPQFKGHYQPHFPDELGYYDLRLIDVQKRQIELAKQYGIYGFCFHYYWFNGKRLLEQPLNQFLDHKEFDFPFCICWANENWTRRWDGAENEILIAQNHSPENDIGFIKDLEPVLKDPRYIRIAGKPLVIVYRATLLPEAIKTTQRWREYCRTSGIGEIYLVAALSFGCGDPSGYGFDAAVEFPPHTMTSCINITHKMKILNPHFTGNIWDYAEFVISKKYLTKVPFKIFKTVVPGWDNTARRPNNASIFYGATPGLYKKWLLNVVQLTKKTSPPEEQIVFINAWNEWAEGTHLEPDKKFGYGYLQATADAIRETRTLEGSSKKKIIVVSHDAHLWGAQMLALHIVKALKENFHYEVHLILKSGGRLEEDFEKYSTVYNLERDYPTRQSVEKLIASLYEDNVNIALCNTVVTGDIVEILARQKIRTVSLIHELPGVIHQYNQEENAQKIARYADRVVFPAAYVKNKFSTIAPLEPEKCRIRPQGLFLKNRYRNRKEEARSLLRKTLAIPGDAKIVLGVGSADFRKGVDLFVQVAKNTLNDNQDLFFVWVGQKDDNPIMKNIDSDVRNSGLSKNILFTGIRTDDLDVFYSGADIFLLTSREDPFPSVVLDAMNAGIPVIGFADAGGFQEIVTDATGSLVPFTDVKKMSEKVALFLRNHDIRNQVGRNAEELIDNQFSFVDYVLFLLEQLGHPYRKVSVIVPNYNYASYLDARFKSITCQKYPIYEIIFLDDGSSDDSVEKMKAYIDTSPVPVRLLVNNNNSGSVFRQWAKGISAARGDYIWIAEADDLSERQFLEEVMRGFHDETVVLSFSQSKQIDQTGKIIAHDYCAYTDDIDSDKWKHDYARPGVDEICDSLAIKNTIPNVSAVVFKKVDISEIVENLVQYKVAGDWFFYIWLLKTGSISYHAQSLNLHRRHEKSVTTTENAQQHFNEIVAIQDYVKNNFALKPDIEEKVRLYREKVHRYLLKKPHYGIDDPGILKT
jgi:arylsulfatase A-like enzyme/glycosyltransferase involved in cell wall biosynthesis/ubiquinone/menaquinone biosynthesis C-methylase UbiE